MTPERLRRIFKEVDVDNDGRLPFACLVDSLRRYDLAAQEQDVSDTLVKLRSPSSDGEDDFSRAWRRKSTTEVTEDEFLAAAKQLMVAKVFAAARRKQAPHVSLVDFGLDDIEMEMSASHEGVARASSKGHARAVHLMVPAWVEIRGDEMALRADRHRVALHGGGAEDAPLTALAATGRRPPRATRRTRRLWFPDLLYMETLKRPRSRRRNVLYLWRASRS